MYDCNDKELENWILKVNDLLRKKLGEHKAHSFGVLVKSNRFFDIEDVKTEHVDLDVTKYYNEDFYPIHEKISESISSKKSGLILLHGEPGTGKTTYIKSLISAHDSSNFIFVQNEFVNSLLDPDFISFLLKQRNSILVIEDAEKVITSREQMRSESVVSTLLQLTDGLFSDYLNIKVICTFNTHLSKIDKALMRKGRLLAMYEFDKLNLDKTNDLLKSFDLERSNEELSIADIMNYKEENFAQKKTKIGF